MRTIRLYQPGDYQVPDIVQLNENAAHHAIVVLRLKPGSHVTLFNGFNEEFDGTIVEINKKGVKVGLIGQNKINRESPCLIHLGQAIIKGDRMEWLLQKAVELGVGQITPLTSDHIAVNYDQKRMAKKIKQWQGIIISACEQCGRNQLPLLNPIQPTSVWLKQPHANPIILLPGATTAIRQTLPLTQSNLTLAIGPEGGWSDHEESLALSNQWHAMSLGPRILRAETAALCALSLLQGTFGDI